MSIKNILGIMGANSRATGEAQDVQVDDSGNVYVNIAAGAAAGGTSSDFSAPFPAIGTAVGASDGTNMQPLLVDGSGNLKVAGSFSASTPSSNTASAAAQTAVSGTASQILAANGSRKGLMIQNTGTTKIYIVLGAGTPSATVYHFALAAGGTANDGSSLIWFGPAGLLWLGAIQAISSAAGGTIVITELT